ncbi:MAG: carbohydrate ABC transporter permease, partial [Candidatus Humimicrobiaceae bacterium]
MLKEFKVNNLVKEILLFIFIVIISFVILLPIFWMIVTSFKPTVEIFSVPPNWFPKAPTIEAYRDILSKAKYIKYFINSYFISTIVALVTLSLASLAAYGF